MLLALALTPRCAGQSLEILHLPLSRPNGSQTNTAWLMVFLLLSTKLPGGLWSRLRFGHGPAWPDLHLDSSFHRLGKVTMEVLVSSTELDATFTPDLIDYAIPTFKIHDCSSKDP